MPESLSRRDFAKRAALVAAGVAVAPLLRAQEKEAPKPEITEDEIKAVEKQLAKPMSEEARTILKTTLKNNRDTYEARMKAKLPENSEPCFVFQVTPAGGKR